MPNPFLFADADLVSPGEITFLKFLGILLMFLWVAYLIKELFFAHRRDPLLDSLTASVSALNAAVSVTSTRVEAQEKRTAELIQTQREDVSKLFTRIEDYKASVDAVLREHEHDITLATALKYPVS
jgi:hypothetical protein